MPHLTKSLVEAAKPPPAAQAFFRDDEIRGFALRIIATGAKSFVWEGRVNGRMRRITIGRYPDFTVALARAQALRIRATLADGRDPYRERELKKHEASFRGLRLRYIQDYSKLHKRSWLRDERRLARCKNWDTRKLSDINANDLLKLQQRIAQAHGRIEANRTLELLRAVFNKAEAWGLSDTNPARRLERFKESRRERFLTDDELRRLNGALAEEINPYWRAYFPLLLLTGVRRSELLTIRWAEIDLSGQMLRLTHTKSGDPRFVPLPATALQILTNLPSRGTSEFLFPGTGRTHHLVEVKTAWARLCGRARLSGVTIHDLRRTLGSRLAIAGVNLPTIGKALGHTNLSATQIYARLDLAAVARALEDNARAMLSLDAEGGRLVGE